MDFKEFNDRVRDIEYGNSGPSYSAAFPALIRKVYLWMTFALAISGIVAYGVATSPNLLMLIYSNKLVFWGIIAVNFLLVWKISGSTMKPNRSLATTTLMFALYSVLTGAILSFIFVVYAPTAIIKTFFITAGINWGGFLTMALLGLILAFVVNIFLKSSSLDFIISIVGVIVFVGLTIWDSQTIKRQLAEMPDVSEASQKLAVCGALSLYLDFINLFLYLLRIFSRDR